MAKTEKVKLEGIVLHVSPYKENSSMVSVFSKGGIISFLARGINKPTSKNLAATQELSHSEFVLDRYPSGKMSLASSSLLESFASPNSFDSLWADSFLLEVARKLYQEEAGEKDFLFLKESLGKIKAGKDPYAIALIYLAKALKKEGLMPELSGCVYCHSKKDIVAISYEEGGLVCKDHLGLSGEKPAGSKKLNLIRYAFLVKEDEAGELPVPKQEAIELINELCSYLFVREGISFQSPRILKNSLIKS